LRSLVSTPLANIADGSVSLSDAPGIGIEPDFDVLAHFLIH